MATGSSSDDDDNDMQPVKRMEDGSTIAAKNPSSEPKLGKKIDEDDGCVKVSLPNEVEFEEVAETVKTLNGVVDATTIQPPKNGVSAEAPAAIVSNPAGPLV